MSTSVTEDLNDAEIQELIQKVAEEYGLETKDVLADINYEVTGGFMVENVDSSQADDVLDTIKNSISQLTGIPVSDVDVNYNSDTGEVQYTLKTDTYDDSNNTKENIDNDAFSDAIKASLSSIDSNINVTSPHVDDAVAADINITVDAKDLIDINDATNNLSTDFVRDGFIVEKAEGTYFRIQKLIVPVVTFFQHLLSRRVLLLLLIYQKK